MKLIKIQGDVFAAHSVTAILTHDPDKPITITIRSDGEDYDYDFEDSDELLRTASEAVQVLQSLDELRYIFN